MDARGKLVELQLQADIADNVSENTTQHREFIADFMMANGVTVQECCHKAESVISKTGLLCTACHSDIDRDAVFCQYCGAKVMPQPTEGE